MDFADEIDVKIGIIVNNPSDGFSLDSGIVNIEVLGSRVVTSDNNVIHAGNRNLDSQGNFGNSSVLIQASQAGEVFLGDYGSMSLEDEAVGTGRVSDNQAFDGLFSDFVQGFTLGDEIDSLIFDNSFLSIPCFLGKPGAKMTKSHPKNIL